MLSLAANNSSRNHVKRLVSKTRNMFMSSEADIYINYPLRCTGFAVGKSVLQKLIQFLVFQEMNPFLVVFWIPPVNQNMLGFKW